MKLDWGALDVVERWNNFDSLTMRNPFLKVTASGWKEIRKADHGYNQPRANFQSRMKIH